MPDLRLAADPALVDALRTPSPDAPWRVLVSGCLAGLPCGVDATDYGLSAARPPLPGVVWVPFCPEDAGLGTPRTWPDLVGGDGHDVWDGRARVTDPAGADLTAAMCAGARQMVERAQRERVDFAVLTDTSGACGTVVVWDGVRSGPSAVRRLGVGVAAAALLRAGVPVVSQRDHATLARLRRRLEPGWVPPGDLRDHLDHPWVREHLRGLPP
jgi:uncharacterized protein YbbK (DUF523 family)